MPRKKAGRGRGQPQAAAPDVPVPGGQLHVQQQPPPERQPPQEAPVAQPQGAWQRPQQPPVAQPRPQQVPVSQPYPQQVPVAQSRPQQVPVAQSRPQQPPIAQARPQPVQPQQLQGLQYQQQPALVAPQIQQGATGGARPRTSPLALVSSTVGSVQQQLVRLTTRDGHDFPTQQVGTLGRKIALKANHFKVDLPRGSVYHYDVDIRPIRKSPKSDRPPAKPGKIRKPPGLPRKMNSKLCRQIIEDVCKKYNVIGSHWPAYDGNKNLYTRKRLNIQEIAQFEVCLMKVPGDVQSEEKFQVTIKPVEKDGSDDCEVSLEPLHEIIAGRTVTYPEEAIHALDIILRYGPSLKFVPVGRSFFMKPRTNEEVALEEGRAVWFGYHQSLRPGWKPLPKGFQTTFYLNIDKTATAFLRPMNLIDFTVEVLHLKKPPPNSLNDFQIKELNKKLKGIQVKALHLPYPRKYRIVKVTRERANALTFDMNNVKVTIEQYFRTQYKKALKFANYPCIQVGDPARKVFLPLEVCEVMDEQPSRGKLTADQAAAMIPHTAIPPAERFKEIGQYVNLTRDNNREILKAFEINISTNPVQFQGRVLAPPAVEYNNNTKAPVRDGQWEMRGKNFVKALSLNKWVIISLCQTQQRQIETFVCKLKESGEGSGMNIDFPCAPPGEFFRARSGEIGKILGDYKNKFPDLQLVVVILPKSSYLYKEVKHEGETNVGLITQCVTDENMRKCGNDKFSFRFLMNICQKINAKLGGTNVTLQKADKPSIFARPVIIIGADVTHPAPGVEDGYSIAACVGSMDAYPARYVTKVHLQKVRNEVRAREERILELYIMIRDLLLEFRKVTRHKPEQIVFFRDGVSEGQFLQVRDYEIDQIRKACKCIEEGYQPKISFIVVQKRHHTRFAPQNFQDGLQRYNANIPAGTTVDTDITHPSYFNFFLASHVALQGTTRPAHYTVLWDDNDFTADTLQKFVFYLCHTYNRCTRSVSIPPPVMYADLAAYRAKLYIDAQLEKMSEVSTDSDGSNESILPEIIKAILTTENVKNQMYFV